MTPIERLSKLLLSLPAASAQGKAQAALIHVNRSYKELATPTQGQTQAYLTYLETLWHFPDAWLQADQAVLGRIRGGIEFFRKDPGKMGDYLAGFLDLQRPLLTA